MYIGFMKMGLSFMLGFLLSCALLAISGLDVLVVFPITIYVYAFFHANNIGGLDDEAFAALEDEYLFGFADMDHWRLQMNGKNRNIAAAVLIILGICMLWDVGFGMISDYVGWDDPVIRVIYYTLRDDVPRAVIALVVIWIGVRMLRGKKEEQIPVMQIEQKNEQADEQKEV